jgi:hypothetical protein
MVNAFNQGALIMQKSHRVWVLLLSISCGVFGVSLYSAAGDQNRNHHKAVLAYPGISCQSGFEPAPVPITRVFSIFTPSEEFAAVLRCPIVRTKPNSRAGVQVDVVVRTTFESDAPRQLVCNLAVLSFDGLQFIETDNGTTNLEPDETSEIMRLRVRTSPAGAYYVLSCDLPNNSVAISQYIVTEL